MRNTTNVCVAFLIGALIAGTCFAQAPKDEEEHFYRLDFVIRELDEAKVVNSRAYSMITSTGRSATPDSIRTGNKVPYRTAFGGEAKYEYQDVGVSIDCRGARELQNQLAIKITTEISSSAAPASPENGTLPLLRMNRWAADVLIPMRRPTLVFSSDDVASKRKMQLEVTATPINPATR